MHQPPVLSRRAHERVQRTMAHLVEMAGGPEDFAESHGLNLRTVHRMMHGEKLPPVGLAQELVALVDGLPFDLELMHHRRALLALIEGSSKDAARPQVAAR